MTLGELVREQRKAKGMSQGQLADKLNLHTVAVTHLEKNQTKKPTFAFVVRICRILDIPIARAEETIS